LPYPLAFLFALSLAAVFLVSAITIVRLIQLTAVAAFTLPPSLFLPHFFHATLLIYAARFDEEKRRKKQEKKKKEENV
jgi:hypothetical protein